jgi:autotransporter-associated beta strand protein
MKKIQFSLLLIFHVIALCAQPYTLRITSSVSDGALPTGVTVNGSNPKIIEFSGTSNISLNPATILTSLNGGSDVQLVTSGSRRSIVIDADITKTSGDEATLTIAASERVVIESGKTIESSSDKLNVVLRSDLDAADNNAGCSQMGTIKTNGGHFWMGGTSTNNGVARWSGLIVGDGPSRGHDLANWGAADFIGLVDTRVQSNLTSGGNVLIWASTGKWGGLAIRKISSGDPEPKIVSGNGSITLITKFLYNWNNSSAILELETTGLITLASPSETDAKWGSFNWSNSVSGSAFTLDYINGHTVSSEARPIRILNYANVGGIVIGAYDGITSYTTPSTNIFTHISDANTTISSPLSANGAVSIYGGSIALNTDLTTTNTSTGNILLQGTQLTGSGNITIASGRNATINTSVASNYAGSISGTNSSVTKQGASELTLSGASSYAGNFDVAGGILRLGNSGTIGVGTTTKTFAGNILIGSGATFEFGSGSSHIFSGVISGAGGLSVLTSSSSSNPVLTLTGQNTFTGPIVIGNTTLSDGFLKLGRTGGGTIASTSSVTISGSDGALQVSSDQELSNLTLESGGQLIVDNGASLISAGNFVNAGVVTNNGTLVVRGNSSFPGVSSTINAMNNLTIDRVSGITLNKDLDVTGTLTLSSGVLDAGTVTLTVSGSLAGASSTTYIKTSSTGGLRRPVSNSAVAFPVGNSTYNPITLTNNTGTADNFTVRVIDEVYANGTSSGTTVSTLRVQRTWDIAKATPSANAGTGVDMVFNWTPASHTSGTLVIPKLYHYESSSWVKKSITTNTTYDVVAGTVTFTGYKGDFSPFAIMDDGTALPVTWLSFTGRPVHGEVELNWSTASEQNNAHFEVERSADAVLFNKIGRVYAATNPRIRNDYRYLDQQPK